MNAGIQLHLSEDDLEEVLMGIGSPASVAHLAACDPCAARLAAFEIPMAAFNHATFAWSAARSHSISRDLAHHKPTPRLTLTAVWSAAAALALALVFGASTLLHRPSETLEAANASNAQTPPALNHLPAQPNEIASDNAMLEAIDSEIVTPEPARFGLYEPAQNQVAPTRQSTPPQVMD